MLGVTDRPQFLHLLQGGLKHGQTELIDAFKAFDKDGDEHISMSELQVVMTSLGESFSQEEATHACIVLSCPKCCPKLAIRVKKLCSL